MWKICCIPVPRVCLSLFKEYFFRPGSLCPDQGDLLAVGRVALLETSTSSSHLPTTPSPILNKLSHISINQMLVVLSGELRQFSSPKGTQEIREGLSCIKYEKAVFIYFLFFFIFYFWERASTRGREAEREGDTESRAGSRLWAVSTEPDMGLELTNHEIMTWVEVGHLTNWAT